MTEPDKRIVDLAVGQAMSSPCTKSRRGAIIFRELQGGALDILGAGFNGPPQPFECAKNDKCRAACRDICLHAEARAVMDLAETFRRAFYPVQLKDALRGAVHLVHVKAVDGELVATGGPSCVQCSKLILDVGYIRVVWLYRLPTVAEANAAGVERGDDPRHAQLARWQAYDARDFHELTLEALGLPTKKDHYP